MRKWLMLLAALLAMGQAAPTNVHVNAALATNVNVIVGSRMPSGTTTLPEPIYSTAGATIVNRTTQCVTAACNTVSGGGAGVTAANINSALSGAPAETYISIPAGTFTMSTMISMKSNVTLRGAGADQTHLQFTGSGSCAGAGGNAWVCFPGGGSFDGTSGITSRTVDCSSGCLAKGATTATMTGSGTMPLVGRIVQFDQIVDGTTLGSDLWPDVWVCQTVGVCITEGNSGSPQSGRGSGSTSRTQSQTVMITAVNGQSITFDPPIVMPNWRSSQTPQIYFPTNTSTTTSAGVENLSVERSSGSAVSIAASASTHIWIKGVRAVNDFGNSGSSTLRILYCYYTVHCTIRDSYIFSAQAGVTDAYGLACRLCSAALFENNIVQHIRAPQLVEQGQLVVTSYNYSLAQSGGGSNPTWQYAGVMDNHGGSGDFHLVEGNDGTIVQAETLKGYTNFLTINRNHLIGKDGSTGAQSPLMIFAFDRWTNAIGNVSGTVGYHNNYQYRYPSPSGTCLSSIYMIGGSDISGNECAGSQADNHTSESLFRWGNWDTVTSTNDNGTNDTTGIKWDSAEVPSSLTIYAQSVPSSHTIPTSLLYNSKPSWFGSVTWPPIGPDVSNGDITNSGGHAYRIPARTCFEDTMGGTYGDTTAKTFNATTCYGS